MSSPSPTKTTSTRLLFSKNIRLNLNSKFLPQDFFPESISQFSKSKRKSQKQNQYRLSRNQSPQQSSNEENFSFQKQARNLQLLKKRLIKIKQSSPSSSQHDSNKKVSFKKRSTSRKGQRKNNQVQKNDLNNQNDSKNKQKGCSKKLMDYMKKMKDVMNIDIKFQQDFVSSVFAKQSKNQHKQNPEDIQTDDSPKIQRLRPKSQITSRQRLLSKQKVKIDLNRMSYKPLKIKVRQTNKIMQQSQQKQLKVSDRYNKFCDIQLNEQGMLTFYANSNKKNKDSYDSRKYTARSSLPKLQK